MKRKHVYYYTYHEGNIKSYEGWLTALYDGANTGWFSSIDDYGIEILHRSCLMKPGEIYYRGVWFEKPALQKAIYIFQKWEQDEIRGLQERINKHEQNIRLLSLVANDILQPAT